MSDFPIRDAVDRMVDLVRLEYSALMGRRLAIYEDKPMAFRITSVDYHAGTFEVERCDGEPRPYATITLKDPREVCNYEIGMTASAPDILGPWTIIPARPEGSEP